MRFWLASLLLLGGCETEIETGPDAADPAAVDVEPVAVLAGARENAWITDYSVRAAAVGDGVIYIGGNFGWVGPPTGLFAAIDATTGVADLQRARVAGQGGTTAVHAAAADGAGGWYIGGNFTSVDGAKRTGLAHILANGELDTLWNPVVFAGAHPPVVYTLAVAGSTVYIGGTFSEVNGAARPFLAAVKAITGVTTSWNPQPNGTINALVVSAGNVYVGGSFSTIGSSVRNDIAAISASTGLATGWNPN